MQWVRELGPEDFYRVDEGCYKYVMAAASPFELAQGDFSLMGEEKGYGLGAGAPETLCHEKVMVSTLSYLLTTILLLINREMTRGIHSTNANGQNSRNGASRRCVNSYNTGAEDDQGVVLRSP